MNSAFENFKIASTKGFILVEVVAAILIMSMSLLAIAGMFIQAIQATAISYDYLIATNLAQKQLELLKTYPSAYWSDLTLPCSIPWCDQTELPLPRYVLTTTAAQVTDSNHLVQVTVTAQWQERGKEYHFQFVTFYSAL